MVLLAQVIGALYGLLAVIFGAFGAHALKKLLSEDQLKSFETGVKYQMYHALVLLLIGFNFNMDVVSQQYMVYCFAIGTFLFSFSIYTLVISSAKGKKMRFLGPITPLGGLLLVCGWALLLFSFIGNLV
ncbi:MULTISPECIES: DUF423 domain-containing protein [unclassified Zobellia]|uniref:DUF423 domain-containing protein n=1 Tax=unclassified Zobellia TaxID=2620635 RepID=UPI001C072FE5|nr:MULTISPECIES: DUF423 domain-containing protein [unclassified Zobellia]MBU2974688.1 DUF423 domain-containing protein [Zobellia sp. B3R18]MDO6820626.1 DUF423 domain-containing protein [Zobellia sp. 1_MG-2023]